MGAISFSLDPRLVAALQSALPLSVLLETGTFNGDTVYALESCFDKVISIELSEVLCRDAIKRFADSLHVRILQGNSGDKLLEIQSELQNQGVLYWLDAHWCIATGTAGELSQCPLLAELQAIEKLNKNSVVLIDDARLFLTVPLAPHETSQWPSFHQIIEQLYKIGSEHELMVVNDVIAFFPKIARPAIENYAKNFGIDWLLASNCLRDNGSFMTQLEEKESVIHEKDLAILEKETAINKLSNTLKKYQLVFSFPLIGLMFRLILNFGAILRPRLGNLNQYAAREKIFSSKNTSPLPKLSHTPKISIVTPSYQQGKFIGHTIQSVLEQNYPNLEYYIQDGGSRDSTLSVLTSYENRLSGWISETDTGQSQAINKGFDNTTGEIMSWLNSDDLLLPGTLHIVADYFNRHPEVDVVYGNRLLIDENDMKIGRWILPGHDSQVLSWADYVPQETLFWRRRIWEKVGNKVDESLRFAMDWDLLVRFRDAGARFGHIPQFLGAFRIHDQQKTSAQINQIGQEEMNRIRKRILGRVPEQKEIHKAVLPYLVKHIAVDMTYRMKKRLGWNV